MGKGSQRDRPKILAVASSGGHWIQLLRLRPAFEGAEVVYVTAQVNPNEDLGSSKLYRIGDANRWNKWRLLKLLPNIIWIVWRESPDVVISTGAAPGAFAVWIGRLLGIRTLWVDSIANAQQMSMSGRLVKKWATFTLSQWPDVAEREGVSYRGAVL